MNIFIYSDESGVFDRVHNDYFVFGGLIFLSKESRDIAARMYSKAENDVRRSLRIPRGAEVKASSINIEAKYDLYRSLNNFYKFGIVIDQKSLLERIFETKKDKQRYLDFAFKIGVKRHFQLLIEKGIIDPFDVQNMHFQMDEHTTATNGRYELREALEQEFRFGTYNYNYMIHYQPIFPAVSFVDLEFCNSQAKTLIRAADIVANRMFYLVRTGQECNCKEPDLCITRLP